MSDASRDVTKELHDAIAAYEETMARIHREYNAKIDALLQLIKQRKIKEVEKNLGI